MESIKKMRDKKFVKYQQPYVYCKSFKDDSGALGLAQLTRLQPITKHINVCYHHFREHVRKGLIKIFSVDTRDQVAEALTKAFAQNTFVHH